MGMRARGLKKTVPARIPKVTVEKCIFCMKTSSQAKKKEKNHGRGMAK